MRTLMRTLDVLPSAFVKRNSIVRELGYFRTSVIFPPLPTLPFGFLTVLRPTVLRTSMRMPLDADLRLLPTRQVSRPVKRYFLFLSSTGTPCETLSGFCASDIDS